MALHLLLSPEIFRSFHRTGCHSHRQKFFSVCFRVLIHFQISIPDRDQQKSDFVKFAQAVIRDIPSQHIVTNLIVFCAFIRPVCRCSFTKCWNFKYFHLRYFLFILPLSSDRRAVKNNLPAAPLQALEFLLNNPIH